MNATLIQLLLIVPQLVLQAEQAFPAGASGADKTKFIMNLLMSAIPQVAGATFMEQYWPKLQVAITFAVQSYNMIQVFKHGNTASVPMPAPIPLLQVGATAQPTKVAGADAGIFAPAGVAPGATAQTAARAG